MSDTILLLGLLKRVGGIASVPFVATAYHFRAKSRMLFFNQRLKIR